LISPIFPGTIVAHLIVSTISAFECEGRRCPMTIASTGE
jgi:hypothetical protein